MENKEKIIYTNINNQNYELEFINGYGNSVAIDVVLNEDIHIRSGEFVLAPLGFKLKLPKGYKAELRPRSSLFMKYGVIQANSMGLIDTTYSGEYKMPLYRPIDYKTINNIIDDLSRGFRYDIDNTMITIPKGTRIGQIEIVKCMNDVELVKVDNIEFNNLLNGNHRDGFGSTGE